MSRLSNNAYFLLVLAPLIWGGNTVVGRMATAEIAPFTFTALRWLLTVVCLLPFVLPMLKKDWRLIRQNYILLLAYGMVGFGGFNLLLYKSLHYTTAVNASLIQAAIPMIILLFDWLFFKEKLKLLQLVGVMLALLGVVFIVAEGSIETLTNLIFNRGDVMVLVSAVLYALYTLTLRFKPNISWLSFIAVSAVGAVLIAVPFVVYEVATLPKVINWSMKSVAMLVYTGLVASILAQLAYAKGVTLIGASRAGIAINFVPVFGAFLAVLILGEKLYFYHFIALCLVMLGIVLSEYTTRQSS